MENVNITSQLHRELWKRFGSREYPAEWDGNNYGGGTLSQRYWEYFKTIELLELTPESVVLDIGGGSPETGIGFFASLLATAVKKVIVMDSNVRSDFQGEGNIEIVPQLSNEATLAEVFKNEPNISHVSCVSVLEHIPPDVRQSIMRGLNQGFTGRRLVFTLEFHAAQRFFEHQLTTRSLAEAMKPLVSFYPIRIEAAPVFSENAFVDTNVWVRDERPRFRIWKRWFSRAKVQIPSWYPLAISFESCR